MRIFAFLILIFLPHLVFAQASEGEKKEEPSESAGAFYQDAVELYGEARYRESIDAFSQAIKLDPQSIYYCNRAVVFLEIGRVSKALEDFQSCESSFEGEADELATIKAQRSGVQSGIALPTTAKVVSNKILADNLNVPPEKGWSLTSWGVLSLGVGAGLIGSAITVDFLSADLVESFVRESEGRQGSDQSRYDALKSDLETRQILFYGLSIGGAVASVLGLSLIIADIGGDSEKQELGLELKANGASINLSF